MTPEARLVRSKCRNPPNVFVTALDSRTLRQPQTTELTLGVQIVGHHLLDRGLASLASTFRRRVTSGDAPDLLSPFGCLSYSDAGGRCEPCERLLGFLCHLVREFSIVLWL